MIYENNKVRDIRLCYIGGGSRGWAWNLMKDLALEPDLSGTVSLYDIDKPAAMNNMAIGNALAKDARTVGKWNYEVSSSLAEGLTGADFVVISILPGTFDDMAIDVHMPEKLGIYQSVGDTAGPGGAIRAMRTLPMFEEFAAAIRDYAPNAWVINYTNPMSLCVKTLYHVFPQIKAFGCCHEVFGTQSLLAGILKNSGIIGDTEPLRSDIHINVLGINHFTWFDSASYKGIDLFPVYRDYIDRHFDEGWDDNSVDNDLNKSFRCKHRVKFDLFRRYGLIAAAGDRHLAEFMPGEMYLKDPETVESWDFGLTSVDWRKEDLKNRLAKSSRLLSGEEALNLTRSGEEGILLIRALCGLERFVSNVNIPNSFGQVANLPRTAVVESNAIFERDAIRPVCSGYLPENVLELVMPHVRNHNRLLKAALDRDSSGHIADRTPVEEAFLTDPLIKGRASEADVRKLCNDMLDATRQ